MSEYAPHRAGREAEAQAHRYLCRQGLIPVARNYRCRGGEIDLVMRDGEALVFVEVRKRSRRDFGGPIESIDGNKRRRLVTAARHYLQRHRVNDALCRFDVIAIGAGGPEEGLQWLRNAFMAGE